MTDPRRGPLEPDVVAALALLKSAGRQPTEALSIDEARAIYRASRDTLQLPPLAVAEVLDQSLGGQPSVTVRLYRPIDTMAENNCASILYFHGGGGVIGDLDTHDSICRQLATSADRVVVAVDYRLGPEQRFPAAPDDAVAAYGALVAEAAVLRLDPTNIVVAGDSAGGALASVAAIAAVEGGLPSPVAALLFYPVTDLRGNTRSYEEVKDVPMTASTMRWFCAHYLGQSADASDWRASPLLAPSLVGFPPTFLTSAGHDPLCDEAFAFAERLRQAGVRVVHRHLAGQIHGYLTLSRLMGEAQRSLTAAASFIKGTASASTR